jgi:peptidoglycan/LPS O-acetylase OafA/YrhL
MRKVYYPGLNGIRAIACMVVFYGHFKISFGLVPSIQPLLDNGVTCFFVLSGFLITSLLLQEREWSGRISLGNFYLRRIFRIWPLYFLVILIGWFAFPYIQIPGELPTYFSYYLLFLGNYAFVAGRCIWIINPLWSVAVEEQFYAFWPLIMGAKAKILRICVTFLATYLFIKFVARHSNEGYYYFLNQTRFDCMAIGGILASLNHQRSVLLHALRHPIAQCLAWFLFAWSIIHPIHLSSFIDAEFFSCIAGVVILNVATNPQSILTLENPILNQVGKISYGIYAYNLPVLYCWHYFISAETIARIPFASYSLPWIILTLNVGIAYFSYNYYEKWFLKAKDKLGYMRTSLAS